MRASFQIANVLEKATLARYRWRSPFAGDDTSRHYVLAFLVLLLCVFEAHGAAAQASNDSSVLGLEREITRIAPLGGGILGVAATHLETGKSAYVNRAVTFPMASAYKIPIAVQLLTRVDRGEIRLDSLIALESGDLHPGSGILADLFRVPGVKLSVQNLLELMLLISDNSAADLVLRLAGGPSQVTARMRALGVSGIRVDRPTIRLIADYEGVVIPGENVTPAEWRSLTQNAADSTQIRAATAFAQDQRDTSTPEGMSVILEKIWRRQALSAASTDILLDILERVRTGRNRLKGMLPPGTVVRHKTGTMGGTTKAGQLPSSTSDVGIIELPGDLGHIAISVFVKESDSSDEIRESVIAQVARAVYDYFLFAPTTVRRVQKR